MRIIDVDQIRMTCVNEGSSDQVVIELLRDQKEWPDKAVIYVPKEAIITIIGPGIVDVEVNERR